MRIISQDGYYDIPYETCNLELVVTERKINGRTEICCHSNSHARCMGVYSTPDKALKAMEMLHDKFLSRMELDGGYDVVHDCYVQPNYWVLPKIFQFPQDSEVDA